MENNPNAQGENQEDNFGENQEVSQFSKLQVYWRIDEGKDTGLEDLGDYENQGVITSSSDDVWVMLNDGEPLEFEDKWGKKCP